MAKLRITYNAPVVLTFTIAALAVFIVLSVTSSMDVAKWFAAAPQLEGTRSYAGLFTHILGHASWEHLLGNFMLILLLGPILEERHGSFNLLVMILITALVTGLANLVFSSSYLVGASGIVFMMILLASMANIRGGEIPLTFIAVAIIYMGGEIVHSFRSDGISHMAHLVGGAVGAAFGFFGARPKRAAAVDLAKPKKPGEVTKLKLPA
ncbi:MAG: Peptidase, family [Myxococcales bacterium]|nr:Peptidase, family [Myxococcales bacterium]